MHAAGDEQVDAGPGGLDLGAGQVGAELLGEPAVDEARRQPPQRLDGALGQRLATPLPEHRAQLVLLGEADPVVAAVQVAVGDGEQVTDLPVGVVDHRVEDRHLPQRLVVRAAGKRDQVDALVQVDPQLAHAGAERPVAHDRRRDKVPAGRPADDVGRDLPAGQGAAREIPQRALARDRLVHAVRYRAVRPDRAEQRRVRGVDQAALHGERAARQQFERLPFPFGQVVGVAGHRVVRHWRCQARAAR